MHEPIKNSTQQQPSKSSASNLSHGGVSMAAVPPFRQEQNVQLKVSTGIRQEVVQRMTFEEGETKIGDLTGESFEKKPASNFLKDSSDEQDSETLPDLPPGAVESFNQIKAKLKTLEWQLRITDEKDHCYTEVIRHYWSDPEEVEHVKHDIPSWAMKAEVKKTDIAGGIHKAIIPGAQFEKIVYYHPKCPLVDLVHEMDHVEQQEQVYKSTGKYLYTTWDAWDWEGKIFEPRSEEGNSAFSSDEENDFRALVAERLDYGKQELSPGQNEYAEYHNYLREYLRYCEWKAPDSEKEKIRAKIAEHKGKAKAFASEKADDAFVKACELIKPISELESEYEIALNKK